MGIYDTAYSGSAYYRPLDDINPDLKQSDPKWSLDWCEYIYHKYTNEECAISASDIERFKTTRLYAQGRQDTDLYKDLVLDEDKSEDGPTFVTVDADGRNIKKGRKGYVNVNFDEVFSPLPKIVQAVIGVIESQEHNVFAQAIDENSVALKEDLKAQSFIKGMFAEYLARLNALMGIDYKEQGALPKNEKEVQLFESLGAFKLKYEIGIQKALDHTLKASDQRKLKRRLIKDLLTTGYCAVEDYFDNNLGEVRARYVDPENLIIESSNDPEFEDASYYGFVDLVTLFQIKHETGLKDEELYQLAQENTSINGNKSYYAYTTAGNGYPEYYQCRVPVLRARWKSNDYEYRTKRTNQNGETYDFNEPYRGMKPPKVYNKDNRSTYKISVKSLYKANWIIGTEHVYDFGKAHNIGYDYKNKDVSLGIHVYHIEEKPLIECCIPIEDQIFLTFIRLQNAIAKSPPPGIAVEYNSLMGMTIENEEWQPLDSLRLYSQTGNIIFSVSPNGVEIPPNYPDPIRELRGGLGTSVQDAMQSFQLAYDNLRVVTGIDDITMSTASPTQQQGKAVTEIAVSATGNTLKPIYSGWLSVKESLCQSIILSIQAAILTDSESIYQDIIGMSAVAALKAVGDKSPVQLGIHIVAAPDDRLKEEIRLAAQGAMAGGKNGIPALTYSEYLFIIESLSSTSGIAAARMYIAMKEAERDQQEREFALASQEKQSIEVQKQNEAKAQQDIMRLEKEKEKSLTEIEAKKNADLEVEDRKHLHKMDELRLQAATKPEPQPVG